MTGSRGLAVGALVTLATLTRTAHAQPSAAAVAQVLFEEGVALMERGDFAEACPKLAESQRIDPGGGTLLDLGACWERLGRYASAYATFNEAASVAVKDGRRDREGLARAKLAELRPKMTFVKITSEGPAEATIYLDDTRIGPAALGLPLPVDAGSHVVAARASGYRPIERAFEAGAPGEIRALVLPRLVPEPAQVEPPPRSTSPASAPAAPSRAPELVLVAGGAAFVVVGGVVGGLAFGQKAESDAGCPTRSTCTPEGAAAMDRAIGLAWTSTIGVGVGAAALVAAAILHFARPGPSRTARAPGVVYTW